ncbi:MAG: tetratricopeptide repeat protein [Candidatus Brocadiales bacterium]|nr:tetratricopeptide repeat protein [Candidatus Bathyanammoxibius sp.]
MKANKFFLVFTAVIVALLPVQIARASHGSGICVTPDGRNVPCSHRDEGPRLERPRRERPHWERPREKADPAIEAYNTGNSLYRQGRYSEAEVYYRRAIALNPRDDSAHWNLSIVLNRQGRYNESVAEIREALRLDPRNRMYEQKLAEWEEWYQKQVTQTWECTNPENPVNCNDGTCCKPGYTCNTNCQCKTGQALCSSGCCSFSKPHTCPQVNKCFETSADALEGGCPQGDIEVCGVAQ